MIIEDKELGQIQLVENKKAKQIIVRYRDNIFFLTHPTHSSINEIRSAIDQMRPRLESLKQNISKKEIITPTTLFETLTFRLLLKNNQQSRIYVNLDKDILSITYPVQEDVTSDKMQELIQNSIENACRLEAKRILPTRTYELAKLHDFTVGNIKINKSRGRWGSCSAKKNINFSYFCMMLPAHLVDFVILHELCHTKEMNHGANFWTLLDKVSEGQAQKLTKELKTTKLKWKKYSNFY